MLSTNRFIKLYSQWLSTKSLTKIAFLNAFSALVDYGSRLVVGFFVTPVLVNFLGPNMYGIWQMLSRLIGYAATASGRPSQALKWVIANKQGSNDFIEKRRLVGGTLFLWVVFLPLLITIGGVLSWYSPKFLNISAEYSMAVRLAAGILIADLIVTAIADIPGAILRGENMEYKRMGLSAVLIFLGGLLTVVALYFNTGIVGIAIAQVIVTLITGILFLSVAKSNIVWLDLEKPKKQDISNLLSLSWWFISWQVITQLLVTGDIVILGLLITPAVVTTYTLTKYGPEIAIGIIANIVAGVLPGLGGTIGSGDFRKAAHIRSEIMAAIWLMAVSIGATSIIWNHSFINLWVGEEYFAGTLPTFLIILMVTQLVILRGDANIIDLTLNLRSKVLLGAVSIVVCLITSTILINGFNLGLIGLCIGFIFGRSILSLSYPMIIGRYLNISFSTQTRRVLRPSIVTFLLFGGSLYLGLNIQTNSWVGLIIFVATTLITTAIVAFRIGLPLHLQKSIINRITHSLKI